MTESEAKKILNDAKDGKSVNVVKLSDALKYYTQNVDANGTLSEANEWARPKSKPYTRVYRRADGRIMGVLKMSYDGVHFFEREEDITEDFYKTLTPELALYTMEL